VRLGGLPAKAVTSGYHLAAIPAGKIRIAADWLLQAVLPRQIVQLGLLADPARGTGSPRLT
jgi:NADH dehydrogenase